jgi:hypothetical protein
VSLNPPTLRPATSSSLNRKRVHQTSLFLMAVHLENRATQYHGIHHTRLSCESVSYSSHRFGPESQPAGPRCVVGVGQLSFVTKVRDSSRWECLGSYIEGIAWIYIYEQLPYGPPTLDSPLPPSVNWGRRQSQTVYSQTHEFA